MVTIFDGMNRMTEEQLRHEIALHEQLSPMAFARIAAQKVKNSSVQIANKVTALFGKEGFSEQTVLSIDDQIEMAKEVLRGKDTEELKRILKANLCREIEELGILDAAKMSEERLSVLIVSKAAEVVKDVPVYMTTLRKAEAIADKIQKKVSTDYRKTFSKNKMIKELLAHTVFVCVRAYDEKFSPAFITLPGFLQAEARLQYMEEEQRIQESLTQQTEFQAECKCLEQAMELCLNQAMTQKSAYMSFEEKEDYLLTKTAAKTEDKCEAEDESETEDVEKMLSETREHMEECLKKQKEFEEGYHAKQAELELLRENAKQADRTLAEFMQKRKSTIEETWKTAFSKLDFKEGVIASVVRNFTYDDRISLEEALLELCMAEHAANLDESLSNQELYHVCRFSLDKGCGRIAYHVKGDRVLVLQIQKSK